MAMESFVRRRVIGIEQRSYHLTCPCLRNNGRRFSAYFRVSSLASSGHRDVCGKASASAFHPSLRAAQACDIF
jgi:hypothetical protein